MTIRKLVSVLVLSLGLNAVASAKEFRVQLSNTGENADGNLVSTAIDQGAEGKTVYELVPATNEIAAALKAKCPTQLLVDGSVLSRTLSFDDENRRLEQETVKVLVRESLCPIR